MRPSGWSVVELLVGQRCVTKADRFGVRSTRHLIAKEIDDRPVRWIGRGRGVVLDDQRLMIGVFQQGSATPSAAIGRTSFMRCAPIEQNQKIKITSPDDHSFPNDHAPDKSRFRYETSDSPILFIPGNALS